MSNRTRLPNLACSEECVHRFPQTQTCPLWIIGQTRLRRLTHVTLVVIHLGKGLSITPHFPSGTRPSETSLRIVHEMLPSIPRSRRTLLCSCRSRPTPLASSGVASHSLYTALPALQPSRRVTIVSHHVRRSQAPFHPRRTLLAILRLTNCSFCAEGVRRVP